MDNGTGTQARYYLWLLAGRRGAEDVEVTAVVSTCFHSENLLQFTWFIHRSRYRADWL